MTGLRLTSGTGLKEEKRKSSIFSFCELMRLLLAHFRFKLCSRRARLLPQSAPWINSSCRNPNTDVTRDMVTAEGRELHLHV
jgi:hypothetical protein